MSAEREYWRDWYEVVSTTEILQGDIFRSMRAYWLPDDLPLAGDHSPAPSLPYASGDWIVLTASCEIARRSDVHVLLARVIEANDATLETNSPKATNAKLEVLRRGIDTTKFLLSPYPESEPPFALAFAAYRQQAFLPIRYLIAHCDRPRLRLKSPLREKLGVWAAMNIGQVGIHDDSSIPKFMSKAPSAADRIAATEDLA